MKDNTAKAMNGLVGGAEERSRIISGKLGDVLHLLVRSDT
jgi:hypothetical protein